MRVVTTVHKAGFEQYGHRWLDGKWPEGTELVLYAEGFPVVMDDEAFVCSKVKRMDADSLWRLQSFKERFAAYKAPSWRYDIVRFSNKVFAAHHALYEYEGIGVWLDADVVTHKPVPEGYVEELLGDAYIAHFARAGHYTETGMWIVNCAHPEHRAFFDTWLSFFEGDHFKNLGEWHDCTTLDATIRLFTKDGRIKTKNLSGEFDKSMHPMAENPAIAKYWDHCKGPLRKELGFSPENEFRKAAEQESTDFDIECQQVEAEIEYSQSVGGIK